MRSVRFVMDTRGYLRESIATEEARLALCGVDKCTDPTGPTEITKASASLRMA